MNVAIDDEVIVAGYRSPLEAAKHLPWRDWARREIAGVAK